MYPTLRFDDKVLVETFSYKSKNRQYVVGDVVVSDDSIIQFTNRPLFIQQNQTNS